MDAFAFWLSDARSWLASDKDDPEALLHFLLRLLELRLLPLLEVLDTLLARDLREFSRPNSFFFHLPEGVAAREEAREDIARLNNYNRKKEINVCSQSERLLYTAN